MRVLMVEDEVRLAEALGQIMAEHRYLADLVYTGPDGLEYGLTNQYDVIVLDVMLPGMDGRGSGRWPGGRGRSGRSCSPTPTSPSTSPPAASGAESARCGWASRNLRCCAS